MIREKGPGLACRFYMSASGNEPVREWLRQMPATVRQLHAIAKKSRKAPPAELDLARRRQREIEDIR